MGVSLIIPMRSQRNCVRSWAVWNADVTIQQASRDTDVVKHSRCNGIFEIYGKTKGLLLIPHLHHCFLLFMNDFTAS